MKNLTKENEITSLELLKEINLFREQEYYYNEKCGKPTPLGVGWIACF